MGRVRTLVQEIGIDSIYRSASDVILNISSFSDIVQCRTLENSEHLTFTFHCSDFAECAAYGCCSVTLRADELGRFRNPVCAMAELIPTQANTVLSGNTTSSIGDDIL